MVFVEAGWVAHGKVLRTTQEHRQECVCHQKHGLAGTGCENEL